MELRAFREKRVAEGLMLKLQARFGDLPFAVNQMEEALWAVVLLGEPDYILSYRLRELNMIRSYLGAFDDALEVRRWADKSKV